MFLKSLKIAVGILLVIWAVSYTFHLIEIKSQKDAEKGGGDFVPTSTYAPSYSSSSVQVKTFLVETGAKEAEIEVNQWLAADLGGKVIIDRKEVLRQDDRHVAIVYWYRITSS